MKLNNRGISIIEIIVTFSLIMFILVGMFSIVLSYRNKASISLEKLDLDTFKNTITKDIQNDILTLGVEEMVNMNNDNGCSEVEGLSKCIKIVFKAKNDQNKNIEKIFGISKIDSNDKNSIENKFLYYDGIKYKLHEKLPDKIPEGRKLSDFQNIVIAENNILSSESINLEDSSKIVTFYSIDVYISHIDFDEDFGIHIVTNNDNIN